MKTLKIPDYTHKRLTEIKAIWYRLYGNNLNLYQVIDELARKELKENGSK